MGGRCLLHDSARLHIALTMKFVFMDYKQNTQPHPACDPQISPDLGAFPKPKEPLRGERCHSLETRNVPVAELSDSLVPVDS